MDFLIAKGGVAYALSTATGTIAGADAIDLLVPGALAVIDDTGALVAAAASSLTGKHLEFVMGTSNGPVVSNPIQIEHATYSKTTYVAPAKKSMFIGNNTTGTTYNLNMPSTIVAGDIASVTITDCNLPYENTKRNVNVDVVMTGGETATQVVSAVNAAINANAAAKKIVVSTVADADNGIKLEALTAGTNFAVSVGGILANADILAYKEIVHAGTTGLTKGYTSGLTAPAAYVGGTGTAVMVAALEKQASTAHGNINSEIYGGDLWTMPSQVVAGETYVVYFIKSRADNGSPLIHENNFDQQLVIAVAATEYDGGETGTGLDTILALLG